MTTQDILRAKGKANHFAERALLVHYDTCSTHHIGEAIRSLDELTEALDAARVNLIALQIAAAEVAA